MALSIIRLESKLRTYVKELEEATKEAKTSLSKYTISDQQRYDEAGWSFEKSIELLKTLLSHVTMLQKELENQLTNECADSVSELLNSVVLMEVETEKVLSELRARLSRIDKARSLSIKAVPSTSSPREVIVDTCYLSVVKQSTKLDLRRSYYIFWSNNENQKNLFHIVTTQLRNFFKTFYLEVDECFPEKDIIYSVTQPSKLKLCDVNLGDVLNVSVDVLVHDRPLSTQIAVSNETAKSYKRMAVSTKFPAIGLQHIHIHKYVVDSSAASSTSEPNDQDSSSEPADEDGEPLAKISKMEYKVWKTCQKAKYKDFSGELAKHKLNSTELVNNKAVIDVLIYCSSSEKCQSMAKFFGFIYVDDILLKETNLKCKNSDVLARVFNSNAKLYRLLNTEIAAKLTFGHNNIGLISNTHLFLNINSNVRASIFTDLDSESDIACYSQYSSFCVHIKDQTNILEFLASITNIINEILKIKSDVKAYFFNKKEEKFYALELSLVTVVPFYLLRFFAGVVIQNSEFKYSYDFL